MIRFIALSLLLMNCGLPTQIVQQRTTAHSTSTTTEGKTEESQSKSHESQPEPEPEPESTPEPEPEPESTPEPEPEPESTPEPEPKPEEKNEVNESAYEEITHLYEELFPHQKVLEECQCQHAWQRSIKGVYNKNNVRDKLDLLAEAQAKTFDKDTIKILYVASGMFLQASTIIASILKAGKNVELYFVDPIYLYATNKVGLENARAHIKASELKSYDDANLAYEQFSKILEFLSKRYNKTARIEAITGDYIPKFLPRAAASKLSGPLMMNRLKPVKTPTAEALNKWRTDTLKDKKEHFDMLFSIDFNGGELELGFYAELINCQKFIYGPHRSPDHFGVFDLKNFRLQK